MKSMDLCVQVISSFARHYKTGEPLPESVVEDICAAKHLFDASVSLLCVYVYWQMPLCCVCKSALCVYIVTNTLMLHLQICFLCKSSDNYLFAASVSLLSVY